jgi:hypothetical protein
MMSTQFWRKNRVWQKWYQSRVNCRNASLVRRVLSLILSSIICETTLFLYLIFALEKLNFYSYLPFPTFPSLDGKDEVDGKEACPHAAT